MSLSIADVYYLKAYDWYPYNMEIVTENLNYALSNNPDHGPANCLMGRILMDYFKDYKSAAAYFEEALICDSTYVDTYKYYSRMLVWMGKPDKAMNIIERGLKVPGMNRYELISTRINLFEQSGKLQLAARDIQNMLLVACSDQIIESLESRLKRVNNKLKMRKKRLKKSMLKKSIATTN